MKNVFDWFAELTEQSQQVLDKPWLILGKGPSFSLRDQYDLSSFYGDFYNGFTMSLNHAVREQPVTLAHMIDFDVVEDCAEAIEQNARFLVLPWMPHMNNKCAQKPLDSLLAGHPFLQKLDREGRLLWYNLSTAKKPEGSWPVVKARFFSAEAGLSMLALAGVKTVRSLGIDGGASYSSAFEDLKDKTLLANGHTDFDKQFAEIAKLLFETNLKRPFDYAPLNLQSPVRVYVGSTEPQMLAVRVLEYSIRKHSSMSVEIFPLHRNNIHIPSPKDPQKRPRTPFSFQRFIIPQLAGFQGRAIYVDSDMQVFDDIRKLWSMPFNGAQLLAAREPSQESGRRPQFSVMLLNCDELPWHIEELVSKLDNNEWTYEEMVYKMGPAERIRDDISHTWNSLERYEAGVSQLVHYTDMDSQPWLSRKNPLEPIWTQDLISAIADGFMSVSEVAEAVEKGYARPSLLFQVRHKIANCRNLPKHATWLDEDFVPPHRLKPDTKINMKAHLLKHVAKLV